MTRGGSRGGVTGGRLPVAALLRTLVRGVRSRLLLSTATVVLCAIAVGSALLGPAFAVAVTNSYVVSRLTAAPDQLTGLSWEFRPRAQREGLTPEGAVGAGERLVRDRLPVDFSAPTTQLETRRIRVPGPVVGAPMLLARDGACERLDLTGECPDAPGEIAMLESDAAEDGVEIGDTVRDGPVLGELTVVGTYTAPAAGEGDFWFDLSRFDSSPWAFSETTGLIPRRPAPYLTVPGTIERLPPSTWVVRVDSRLAVTPEWTPDRLSSVSTGSASGSGTETLPTGTLTEVSLNDLPALTKEIGRERRIALASVAPAVVSLILVAGVLLVTLLSAAAERRLPELALGTLRGMSAARMWTVGLAEPLALLVLAVPLGLAAGLAANWWLVRAWLVPGLPLRVPWLSVLAVGLVVCGALAIIAVSVGAVLWRSLAEQLSGIHRPARAGRAGRLAVVCVVAVTVVLTAAKAFAGAASAPDAGDALLPVLLGLVAGLTAMLVVAGAARRWIRRRRSRSVSSMVALRAVARRREPTLVVLPLAVAVAVTVFGAGVYQSAATWRASVAATEAPAATVWTGGLPLSATLALARELDPEGRWLMGAGTVGSTDADYVVVDSPRLARVGIWPDTWTPGLDAADIAALIGPGPMPEVTGRRLGIQVTVPRGVDPVHLAVPYQPRDGAARTAYLGPYGPGTSTRSTHVDCVDGCAVQGLTLGGPAGLGRRLSGRYVVGPVTVDGEPAPGFIGDGGWVRGTETSANQAVAAFEVEDDRLVLSLDSGTETALAQLSTGRIPALRPAVVGRRVTDFGQDPTNHAATSSAGIHPPVTPVARSESTPFSGPLGVLVDATMMTSGRSGYDRSYTTYVLANDDTPGSVARELAARGLHVATTNQAVTERLAVAPYSLALRLYAITALLVALMALAGLVVSTAVQLPDRRRDAASLRVVGVPVRSVMAAAAKELFAVLGAAAVAGLLAGWGAQLLVLRTVTLDAGSGAGSPRLSASIDLVSAGVIAVVLGALMLVIALGTAVLVTRRARAATLREAADR